MKCKTCKQEIEKFKGKYWHVSYEEKSIERYKQKIYSLSKKQFFPSGMICSEPKVI